MKRKQNLIQAKIAPVSIIKRNKTPTAANTYTNLLSPNESFQKIRGTMQNFHRKMKPPTNEQVISTLFRIWSQRLTPRIKWSTARGISSNPFTNGSRKETTKSVLYTIWSKPWKRSLTSSMFLLLRLTSRKSKTAPIIWIKRRMETCYLNRLMRIKLKSCTMNEMVLLVLKRTKWMQLCDTKVGDLLLINEKNGKAQENQL